MPNTRSTPASTSVAIASTYRTVGSFSGSDRWIRDSGFVERIPAGPLGTARPQPATLPEHPEWQVDTAGAAGRHRELNYHSRNYARGRRRAAPRRAPPTTTEIT
ncbi:hypothetical protein GCM10009847_14710 [Leucobacter tardus]